MSDDHHFPDATHLLLQNEIHARSTRYAVEHSRGATTILNPSPLPSPSQLRIFPWSLINWLIVNEGEAEDLFRAVTDQEIEKWSSTEEMLRMMSAVPCFRKTNIICTLGARGVVAILPADDVDPPFVIYVPAAKLDTGVNDTTGAGDCFTGYFVRGLMRFGPKSKFRNEITEKDVEDILKFAAQVSLTYIFEGISLSLNRQRGFLSRDRERWTVFLLLMKSRREPSWTKWA